jgi:hypothetical protein
MPLGLHSSPLTTRADISRALHDCNAIKSFATAGAIRPFFAMWKKPAFTNPMRISLITDGFAENAFHHFVDLVQNSFAKPVHSIVGVHASLKKDFIRIDVSDPR